MTTISVLIPTVFGRELHLQQAVSGYVAHTPREFDLEFVILRDRPTCGRGWQEAAERAHGDFFHFSNDDVYPWDDWCYPLIEAVQSGYIAAPWISHGPWGQYLAAPEGQVHTDWLKVDHSAMPFMHRAQFDRIQPIIATHYGVDNWIGLRARAAGMKVVGRKDAILCHFASRVGRQQGDPLDPFSWTEQDLIDYDCCIALPAYQEGLLDPRTMPGDRLTPLGLRRARQWRKENVL